MAELLSFVKRIARSTAPGLFFFAKSLRRAWHFRWAHGGAEFRAKRALVRSYGQKVLAGPFVGMRYGDDVACSAYVAKLAGSYEDELHGVVEEIIQHGYQTVIDMGCAEGYYAIGFALRLPQSRVFAYDTDESARRYCADLARLNGVESRVEVRAEANHAELSAVCGGRAIIICDCEGFEDELLNPVQIPELVKVDILVELHEFLRSGVTKRVLARFESTHETTIYDTRERDVSSYPVLEVVPPEDRLWAIREGRPAAMQWAYLKASGT